MSSARAAAALAISFCLQACGCGPGKCRQETPRDEIAPFAWSELPPLDEVPARGMTALLAGAPMRVSTVQLRRVADDAHRLEISDGSPDSRCGPIPEGQGFSVKLPGPLQAGETAEIPIGERVEGASAFTVLRDEHGAARSVMAAGFGMTLRIDTIDEGRRRVTGRVALLLEDGSGAAGTFEGQYCPD